MIKEKDIHVLIVDDEPDILDLLKEDFEDEGFITHAAQTLEQAKYVLSKEDIHAVVTDLHLLDGTGEDLIDDSSLPKGCLIYFMSGYYTDDELKNPLVTEYLSKPILSEEIALKIKESLKNTA